MDLRPTELVATNSSPDVPISVDSPSSSEPLHSNAHHQSESNPAQPNPQEQPQSKPPVRSSARVKAAKQKEKEKEKAATANTTADSSTSSSPEPRATRNTANASKATSASTTKRGREQKESVKDNKGKGIVEEPQTSASAATRSSKRTRRAATSGGIVINEPAKDIKGKKRAAPEDNSDDEYNTTTSSASSKRPRTTTSSSAYSLRSRTDTTSVDMPKKATRTSTGKGKMTTKSKAMAVASTSRVEDEDVDMMDAELKQEEPDCEDRMDEDVEEKEGCHDDEAMAAEGGGNDDGGDDDGDAPARAGGGPDPMAFDESAAMAIFGDFRSLGTYMMGLSSRLKTMLNNIKMTADPTTRLVTLQELSELLSISTEDTLAGSFQVEQFVRELVRILGGTGNDEDEDDGGDDHDGDEDAALAAALAMSAGGTFQGDENLEAQVLACRCLANLMEALPGVAHTVVYHGAIPVLCSKLIEISYIDLAEQTLSTLEKISEEFPSSIVREGGLAALLNYLDFFSIAVQRTALQAAANCCRNISAENFSMIRGVWPIIRNCLAYSDQRLVEFACLCVIRVIESYYRSYPENLESLVDTDLIKAVNMLLLPAGGSPLIAANTFTQLLRALATSARSSAKITVALLEADIVDTLYQILTGVLPSSQEGEDRNNSTAGQGLGGSLADMTVMQNLAHRPKDQVEEALSLVSELMPPTPKDGVFDHKGYTEKALSRMMKAKAKAERAAARQAAANVLNAATGATTLPAASTPATSSAPLTPAEDTPAGDAASVESQGPDAEEIIVPASISSATAKETAADRTELLRSKPEVVGRFMQLIVPILIDIYAASVSASVRIKTLTSLLKAVSFLDDGKLKEVLTFVPIASFASSVLSSKDHPTLVIGALQLVDLLLTKLLSEYKPAFRREGVFHEIEALAARNVTPTKPKDKDKAKDTTDAPSPVESAVIPPLIPVSAALAASIPGFRKLSSLSLEPEDAITLRCRVIRFKYLSATVDEEDDNVLKTLRDVASRFSKVDASEQELLDAFGSLAGLFSSPHTSVSSFELLQSGVVDGLLECTTCDDRTVSIRRRQELLYEAFSSVASKDAASPSSLSILVKKLQESLTKMESFEVSTVSQGIDDSKRSSPSLLARQLRLRLVAAEDSDIPRNLSNIVVSIHAIATFQALHDYLRPRVANVSGSSRLSGLLAALAASGLPPGFTPRSLASETARLPPSLSTRVGESSTSVAAAAASSSNQLSGEQGVSRRRSLRLSAKKNGPSVPTDAGAADTSATGSEASTSNAPADASHPRPPISQASVTVASSTAEPAPSDTLVNDDDDHGMDFPDDEIDAEIFDEDMDPDNSVADEKTVNLSVADDGSKIEAQTPEGTRVATPNPLKDGLLAPTSRGPPSSRGSYAAALKTKPTDWHLEFFMDDHPLPLDLTIYGAIHQHEMRKKSGLPPSLIWQGIYTVKFKKVSGPSPSSEGRAESSDAHSKNRSPSPTLSSLPEDASYTRILRLLRVLHRLNILAGEMPARPGVPQPLDESAFINNKLSAKLTRQLEEPMIVASSCLPDWALDLPLHFPFLFPFSARYNFLQSTSFGYARLIMKWQSQQSQGRDSSRRDDSIAFLGRLQRQKVRISRKHILESAVKVFELYGSSSSILEVEYFEEVGTGLGPTLEFYSLVSKEFARRDIKLWRDEDSTHPGIYAYHPHGLFPAPIGPEDSAHDGEQKRTHLLRVIGQFVAKAMLDSRIIDLSFNKIFLKLVLGFDVPLTIESLKYVDLELANSLDKLRGMIHSSSPRDKPLKAGVVHDTVHIEDLALDFTLPGYDIELKPGGRDIPVTSDNAEEYIHEVLDASIGSGIRPLAAAFREGFSKVFPISDLQAFSVDELAMLFGNADEDWSVETLSEALKADHGFNVESRAIRDLVEIMSEYDAPARREYLQFITGSPKLPIGGFRGLNPSLTVVRKPHEAPLTADDYLPSVMTCVNYLKLPDYSSKTVMREKLRVAMKEGVGSFHLS